MLLKLVYFICYHNFLIALAAASQVVLSALQGDLLVPYQIVLLAFFSTLVSYNLVVWAVRPDSVSHKYQYIYKYRLLGRGIFTVSAIVCIVLLFYISCNQYIVLAHLAVISFLYTVAIPLGPFRLGNWRRIPYLKIALVAYVWAITSYILPHIDSDYVFSIKNISLAISHFIYIFSITLLFDIRDLDYDKSQNLKTIAAWTGVNGLKVLSLSLWMGASIILMYYSLSVAMVIHVFLVALTIILTSKKRKELYFTGWIDFTIILQLLAVFI